MVHRIVSEWVHKVSITVVATRSPTYNFLLVDCFNKPTVAKLHQINCLPPPFNYFKKFSCAPTLVC